MAASIEVPKEIATMLYLTTSRLSDLDKDDFVVAELSGPATHLLKVPGKLIRPGLVFSSALMFKQELEKFVDLAMAIELLHTASLVHDDILDRDSVRRGVDAVHTKYGSDKAILAGDALIAKAIELASPYGGVVVKRAAEAAKNMCAGETLDIERQKSGRPMSLDEYKTIAELKTASLIATSTSVVADYIDDVSRNALYDIGFNIGMSFQIRDDIMNYAGTEALAKKPVGNDSIYSRPNIVSVFEQAGRPSPLKTAIKLNNYYVDGARALLQDVKSDMFERYLDFLSIA